VRRSHDAGSIVHRREFVAAVNRETVRAERDVATSFGTRKRIAFCSNGSAARCVIDLCERCQHGPVVAAALHGKRALRRRRHETLRIEA
jgi:hypothetical protein